MVQVIWKWYSYNAIGPVVFCGMGYSIGKWLRCTTSRRAVYVILGCTVWMYAKLFHAKLCYLILRCITSPNTVPFHPGLTHSTSRWTVSLDSVSFHSQLFHLTLYQLLLCSAISYNAIPFDITLAQLKLCCAAWIVLWHDQIILWGAVRGFLVKRDRVFLFSVIRNYEKILSVNCEW